MVKLVMDKYVMQTEPLKSMQNSPSSYNGERLSQTRPEEFCRVFILPIGCCLLHKTIELPRPAFPELSNSVRTSIPMMLGVPVLECHFKKGCFGKQHTTHSGAEADSGPKS